MTTKTTTSRQQKADAIKEVAAKQPLLIFGPNLGTGTTFHVMAKSDRKKNSKPYKDTEPPMEFAATSVQEIVEFVYADQLAEDKDAKWTDYEPDFTFLASAAKQLGLRDTKKATGTGTKPKKQFPDSTGRDIQIGDTVKKDGKIIGKAAYRVHHGKMAKEGKIVPMIGVALAESKTAQAAASVNGRTVKRRSFFAKDLTVVTK